MMPLVRRVAVPYWSRSAPEHLIQCEHCRGLTRLLDKAGDGLRPSESLLRRIKAGILEDLKPIRPLAPSRILLFGCAIIFSIRGGCWSSSARNERLECA